MYLIHGPIAEKRAGLGASAAEVSVMYLIKYMTDTSAALALSRQWGHDSGCKTHPCT